MKKRILALLLIFCMVLTMLPVQIFAEANTTGEVMGSFKLEIVPVEKKTVYNLDKEASFNLYLSAGEDATADFAIIRSLQADITGVDFTLTDVTTAHGQAGVLPEEATIVFLAGDDTDPLILFNGEKLLIGTVTGKVENTTFSVKGTAEVAEGPTTFTNTEEYAYYGTVGPQLIPVSKPTAVEEALIYNGQEQTGVIYDPNSEAYSVDYEPSATAAGLHYARFTLKDGYVWEGGDTEPFGIEWWIAKAPPITIIPEPGQSKFKDVDYEIKYHYDGELFDGDDFEGTLGIEDEHVGDCAITIGDLMIVGANGVDNYDISIANETIEVKKNTVAKPTAVEEALIYNGQEQTGVDYDPNCEAYSVDGETSAVGAGQHSATFTLKDGCVWDDGDEERTCEVDWEIKKAPMLIIPEPRQSKIKDVDYEIKYHYDGELFDGDDFVGTLGIEDEQVGDCAITIGDLMIVGANGADNYDISIAYGTIEVKKNTVAQPTAIEGLIYNGQEQTGVDFDPNSEAYEVSFQTSATAAGPHTATFTLNEGYVWEGGDGEPVEIEWSIAKAKLTVTADNKEVIFGDDAPDYTVRYDGFVNGEDESVITTGCTAVCDYEPGSVYQELYNITVDTSRFEADNYEIGTTKKGTLTVREIDVYTVTYDANGGEGAPAQQRKFYGKPLTLSEAVPTRKGFTFLGWAGTADATEAEYLPGGSYEANLNVTLYAVWEKYIPSGKCGNDLAWVLDDGVLTVSGSGYMTEFSYMGQAPWDEYKDTITKVVVTDGVQTVGKYAFYDCTALTDVTLADSVQGISSFAFSGCSALKTLRFGSGMIQIKNQAFILCTLTDVYYNGTQTQWGGITITTGGNEGMLSADIHILKFDVTYNANGGENAPEAQLKTAGEALTLSEAVPTRAGFTFLGWATSADATEAEYQPGGIYEQDTDVTLFAVWSLNVYTVTYDANGGEGAPAQQSKTEGETLTLSETVPTRKGFTFLGWAETSDATEAVYQPGESYVADESVTLYALWKKDDIIGTTGEVSWKLDENGTLTVFGEGYMADALSEQGVSWLPYRESIRRAVIGSGVKNIGAYAFYDCTNLTGVKICDTVTYVGNMAFKGCTKLYQIALPDSVTNVGNGAFAASGLRQAALGSGLTEIGDDAFWGCTYLNCVMIPGSVTDIGENAFYNANPRIIYFDGDLDQWQTIYNKSEIFSHAVEYYKNDKVLNGSCGEFSSYSLTVGSGRLTLSGSGRADGIAWRIGENYYGNIPRLIVTVEDEITAIGTGSFRNLPVTAITIGRGVKTIEDGAFEGYNQLADVYYNGTEAQWNEIAVGTDNEDLLSAAIHFSDERRIEAGETVRLDESTQQKLILDGGTLILGEGVEATVEAYSGTLVLKDGAVATLNDVLDLQIVDESNYSKETDTFLGGEAVVKLGEEVSAVTLCGLCNYDDTQMAVLPLYDAEKDGYRLFKTEFDQRTPISVGSNGYKFRFRPIFLNEDGFTLFKQQDSSVDVCFELRYNGEQFFIDPSDSGIYTFGTDLRNQFCDKHSTTLYYISVSGLKDGDTFEVLPCFLFNGCKVCQNEIVATK